MNYQYPYGIPGTVPVNPYQQQNQYPQNQYPQYGVPPVNPYQQQNQYPMNNVMGIQGEQAFLNEIFDISKKDAFLMSQATAEQMITEVARKYNKTIISGGMGQNRIIVTPGINPNAVYKIAYKHQGRQDNIGEFQISEFIRASGLTNVANKIAMTLPDIDPRRLYDGVIIAQEKVLSWTEKASKEMGATNIGLAAVTSLFTTSPNSFRTSLILTIQELSKYFLLYDAHPKNPFNYGLKRGSDGQIHVCNLDYGYWVILSALAMNPMKATVVNAAGLVCPKCSRGPLNYLIPESSGNAEIDMKNLLSSTHESSQERFKCSSCNEVFHATSIWTHATSR